jgi:hypothetical protein
MIAVLASLGCTAEPIRSDAQHYANGYVRPAVMANLPEWALREFLIRHSGPALEAARDEAEYRGWPL